MYQLHNFKAFIHTMRCLAVHQRALQYRMFVHKLQTLLFFSWYVTKNYKWYATALEVHNIEHVWINVPTIVFNFFNRTTYFLFLTVQHIFNYVSKRMSQYTYVSCIIDNCFFVSVWWFFFSFAKLIFQLSVFCDINLITINY